MEFCYHRCHYHHICWREYPWNKWVTRTTFISSFDRLMGVNIAVHRFKKDERKVKHDSFQLLAMVVLKELELSGYVRWMETGPSSEVIQVVSYMIVHIVGCVNRFLLELCGYFVENWMEILAREWLGRQ